MNPIYNTYRPEGFSTVNSYLFVENPEPLIDFLTTVFHAEEVHRTMRPDTNEIGNLILKIGDTCIMISQANGPFMAMRTSFYLYVNDVDEVYGLAMKHGAKSVFEPADMDYGDRQGGIEDPVGNYWWISKRLEEKSY